MQIMSNNMRLPVLLKSPSVDAHSFAQPLDGLREESAGLEPALMQIGDLARESGKTVRAIHLYEELDLLKPAARSKGRFRLYGREALVRIRWISKLQDLGFSLTDIQAVAKDFDQAVDGGSASVAMSRMRELYR